MKLAKTGNNQHFRIPLYYLHILRETWLHKWTF